MPEEKYGFRVGDTVVFTADRDPDRGVVRGQIGRVCNLEEQYEDGCIGVEWDLRQEKYHDCGHTCKNHHGWWVPYEDLAHVQNDIGEFEPSDCSIDTLFS